MPGSLKAKSLSEGVEKSLVTEDRLGSVTDRGDVYARYIRQMVVDFISNSES